MTENTARKAGRPPKSGTSERMKARQVRMLDEEWEDAKFIGMDRVRAMITTDAARKRKKGR